MANIQFYQDHLNRVSRSFAFCIAELEGPLREWVSLTYLICRILDTIEDSSWPSIEHQLDQFAQFDHFLQDSPTRPQVKAWIELFPDDIPEGEKILLADSVQVFSDFHALPAEVRHVIYETVLSMSRGMQHFIRLHKKEGCLRLSGLVEVNQYCFFVAGVVGESLAKLLAMVDQSFTATPQRLLESHHFGQFLQKVNLLKDQAGDVEEGREFISSRGEVLASALINVKKAFAFLESVPQERRGFRLFCAWSLFLGLASLPWSEKYYDQGKVGKIPRWRAQLLLRKVEKSISQPVQLKQLFREHLEPLVDLLHGLSVHCPTSSSSNPSGAWIQRAYVGRLGQPEWVDLGMLSKA